MRLTAAVVVVVGGVLLLGMVGATQVETVTEVTETTQVEENNEVPPQDYHLTNPEQRIISVGQADMIARTASLATTLTCVAIGLLILFREFLLGIGVRLYRPEEGVEEEGKAFEYNRRRMGHHSYQQAHRENNYLTWVLNGLDSAQTLWRRLETNELSCRRLAVCEAERAAPAIPVLNAVMTILRPTLRDSKDLREALEAGQTLQDCALLYSQCPVSLSQAIWH